MRAFYINLPIYYDVIYFCVTPDKAEAKKYFLDEHNIVVSDKPDTVQGYCIHYAAAGVTGIWLPRIPETSLEFGNLHHEVYHAVHYILQTKGVKDFDEPYAYLLGYVINVFYNMFPPIRRHDYKIFGKKIWVQ